MNIALAAVLGAAAVVGADADAARRRQADADVAAAVALLSLRKPAPQPDPAPPPKPVPKADPPAPFDPVSYPEGCDLSRKLGLPLVTFVGRPPAPVSGAVIATADGLPGLPARCVVVSRWDGDRHVLSKVVTSDELPADIISK